MYNPRHRDPLRSASRPNVQQASLGSPPLQGPPASSALLHDKENARNDNVMSPVKLKSLGEQGTVPDQEKPDVFAANDSSNHNSIESLSSFSSLSSIVSSRSYTSVWIKDMRSLLWLYGMLQLEPEAVLGNQGSEGTPFLSRQQIRGAYFDILALQNPLSGNRRFRSHVRAFGEHQEVFAIQNSDIHETDSESQNSSVDFLATQQRSPIWMSKTQRGKFLDEVKGDLLNTSGLSPRIEIPVALHNEENLINEVTFMEMMGAGGFKQVFDAGGGRVWLKYSGDIPEEFHERDLMVTQLCSGLSALSPNFPRLCSSPFLDSRSGAFYVMMPKYNMNLLDYIRRIEHISSSEESKKVSLLMSICIQICFGVLAGQSVLGLHFRDLKPSNIMLDGQDTHKFYCMSFGSRVFVFESVTEEGYGTAKIIDYSTTTVKASATKISDCVATFSDELSTSYLTPLEAYLVDNNIRGFHRDVHNIMLMIINLLGFPDCSSVLEVPEGFVLTLAEDINPKFASACYLHLVLLSKPGEGESIIDILSSDPTFEKSHKFQAFKTSNEKLLKSKEFARDVGTYSLLGGSKFADLRKRLGNDKVELLWKGMAPNPALRPTLTTFMCAFFKEHTTEVEASEEALRGWYDANVTADTEVIPLFLEGESHVEMLVGSNKDSFVLKSDQK